MLPDVLAREGAKTYRLPRLESASEIGGWRDSEWERERRGEVERQARGAWR